MSVKLAFGLQNDRIVHISELAMDSRGENCNCVCPVCHGKLVAKLGEKNRHHFAHKDNRECSVFFAQQTGLHLFAKEVIQRNHAILVPGWEIKRSDIMEGEIKPSVAAQIEIALPKYNSQYRKYQFIQLEKQFGSIIADAVIEMHSKQCLVEIAVTHFVDDNKRAAAERLGIPMFEIDLSDMMGAELTREEIEKAVLLSANRKWIYNPKINETLKEIRKEFSKQYEARLRAEIEKQRKQENQRMQNIQDLKHAMEPENYRNRILQLRDDKSAQWWMRKFYFAKEITSIPFYLNIPISGELVFACDRRIWQGKLFEDYVYSGFGEELTFFSVSQIQKRIYKDRLMIKFDKSKVSRVDVLMDGVERSISLSYDVIKQYFDYLSMIGFISWTGRFEAFSRRPASMTPPNPVVALALREAIEAVDPYDPCVSKRIEREMRLRIPDDKIWDDPFLVCYFGDSSNK